MSGKNGLSGLIYCKGWRSSENEKTIGMVVDRDRSMFVHFFLQFVIDDENVGGI
jgi:hypothetical protein